MHDLQFNQQPQGWPYMYLPENIGDAEIIKILMSHAVTPSIVSAKHAKAFRAVHYAINRKHRYGSVEAQLDMQFHGTWEKNIKDIKEGWPKPTVEQIRCLQDLPLKNPRALFPGTNVLDLMTVMCYGKFSNLAKSVVVGSSPSLLGRGLGREIDRYANVIRVNWYPTSKRFIPDIGTREDVLVIKTSSAPGREAKRKLNLGRDLQHKCRMNPKKLWIANMPSGAVINQPTKDFLQECFNTTDYVGYGSTYRGFAWKHGLQGAFTGTQAIVLAHIVTGEPVDIVGFCGTAYDSYRHYYDSAAVSYQINHSSEPEDQAIIKLLQLGVIGRVLDVC